MVDVKFGSIWLKSVAYMLMVAYNAFVLHIVYR